MLVMKTKQKLIVFNFLAFKKELLKEILEIDCNIVKIKCINSSFMSKFFINIKQHLNYSHNNFFY